MRYKMQPMERCSFLWIKHRKIAGGQPAIFLKMRGKERRKNEEAIYIGTLLRGDYRLAVLPCRRVLFRQEGQCMKREENT